MEVSGANKLEFTGALRQKGLTADRAKKAKTMNLAQWLWDTAGTHGDRVAIWSGVEKYCDYKEFLARSLGLAAALRARGIQPGDRVAIFAKNCPEYLIAFYGIWAAGAVAVPINGKLHPKEAIYIIDNSGSSMVFTSGDMGVAGLDMTGPQFAKMCHTPGGEITPRLPDDLCWLFYTSGTTGQPKGVMITHGMVATVSAAYPGDVDPVLSTDSAVYAAPMSHGAGLYISIHVREGAGHVVPKSGGFDPAEVLELSKIHGATSMFMAPTMVRRLLDAAQGAGEKGNRIKTIIYGGGPMYLADIVEAVDWFGPKFVQIYGQGECPMGITALTRAEAADRTHPRWQDRLMSVGRAQSPVEVAIADDGEILVKGAPVMPGYWENPGATEKTLQNEWLRTGDVGKMDADGYVTLIDRSKDLIISGGTNIYPREIEEVLLQHPDVHEVSVVGRPSPEWGEDVVAFVVGAADAAELNGYCLENMARFKRPKEYFKVEELPKNNYGKVLKTELRKRL